MQSSLPPAVFDFALGHGYYGLRAAVSGYPGRGCVLPDFLIIGAAKCGTTSLHNWICQHPLVARPMTNGRVRKELLFFDYNFRRGPDWYRSHFPPRSAREEFARAEGRPFLAGEATASYLSGYWVPERVARLLPDVKLIVTLRDPVDRTYSAFQMSRREGLEECERFETALALEDERLAPELARTRRDRHYNPPVPPPLGYWSYLQRSRYAEHVERWLEHVRREQMLFLRFEDLVADPQSALDSVYSFLGLPPHRHPDFPRRHVGGYEDQMSSETRAALRAYFRPHNERLGRLTGIDFGWDE